jgi:hypothetical protein
MTTIPDDNPVGSAVRTNTVQTDYVKEGPHSGPYTWLKVPDHWKSQTAGRVKPPANTENKPPAAPANSAVTKH